ncbi:hypothetical protein DEO72_LG7g1001 [Vigna unguiculata]|uniref:Uncharacterized protein n=1 Tax=Vigna unguiculata TaxID=3917 RepID=A0A4D6MI85_VIGUN|nr:hypothetical protein DEO72_LG7g1001 [Vigna unguiculata]
MISVAVYDLPKDAEEPAVTFPILSQNALLEFALSLLRTNSNPTPTPREASGSCFSGRDVIPWPLLVGVYGSAPSVWSGKDSSSGVSRGIHHKCKHPLNPTRLYVSG